jgi:glycerate 2-kinase
MNILIAPDKYKGSLSAKDVCQALYKGLQLKYPSSTIISKPLADGGDGSLDVLEYYHEVKTITKTVQDPLGRPIVAQYKMSDVIAYIEMAAASGLVLLQDHERNCMQTSTFGTGELIADAIEKGAKEIYLFIGGSATNDGGIGIAAALGYCFMDNKGNVLSPIGKNLESIQHIDDSKVNVDFHLIKVVVISDVNNPLYGKNGAALVYASQKGASPKEIVKLDHGLKNLSDILHKQGYRDIAQTPGSGAGGGVGGGAMAFLNAELKSGIEFFLDLTGLEQDIIDCDVVITGEGMLDKQTEQGKVISGVCSLAKKYNKKVIAVCGAADFQVSEQLGLTEVYTVISRSTSMQDAMENTTEKLVEIMMEIEL